MTDKPTPWKTLLALVALVWIVLPVAGSPVACSLDGEGASCCCAPAPGPSSCCSAPTESPEDDGEPPCACKDPSDLPPSRPATPAPRECEAVELGTVPLPMAWATTWTAGRIPPARVPRPRAALHVLHCVYLT